MELQTISQVSKDYGVSPRMLRYYEQTGLLESKRMNDYAYRMYDEEAISRLRQIIVLRKLRIPVKQIVSILSNADGLEAVEIFRQNISEIDGEITALSTIRSILNRFVTEIHEKTDVDLKLLGDDSLFSVVSALSFSDNHIKESKEGLHMNDLNKASEDLMKLEDRDVRIVYLPPMTVAAAFAEGENTEGKTGDMILQFVNDTKLLDAKPDARSFGFDCSPVFQGVGVPSKMYEAWVSIPDDMDVPPPMVKRRFGGGLYAAHVLRAWDFEDWRRLKEWVNASEKFVNDWDSPRWESAETKVGQGFEETMNFYSYAKKPIMRNMQLDLLFPIREARFLSSGEASYIADGACIQRSYKHQYDEETYNLPENLDLAGYRSVTVSGKSPEGKTAVKFYDVNGEEAFVMYNNQSEDYAHWTYELTAEYKTKTINAIGIMSQDAKGYAAEIRSVTFTK